MRDDDKRDPGRTGTYPSGTGTSTLEAEHEQENLADLGARHEQMTGEPDNHAVGTGVGAAGGAATGAAVGGAVGGPPGALIGAAIGGIIGGFAGRGIAEAVNPEIEDAYWRENYRERPYAAGRKYEELQPAYRYGWEQRLHHADRGWNQAENDMERGWDKARGTSSLKWQEAKGATQDAWNRVTGNLYEDDYWRQNYSSRPYAKGRKFEDLAPAYRYGAEARERYAGRNYNDVEGDLRSGWERTKDATRLRWDEAKDAIKDAFGRNPDWQRSGVDRVR